jgi:hypothetical protein
MEQRMEEEKHICKNKADHPGHLCMLASARKLDEIKCLTQHPKHLGFNCGRVADSDRNLCNPMPLA